MLILIWRFDFLAPKVRTLIIWSTWWRIFQKSVDTKLCIYVFITRLITRFKRDMITLFRTITFLWWRWQFKFLPVMCTSRQIQKPTASVVGISGVSMMFTNMAPRNIKMLIHVHYVFCFYLYFIICIYVCWSNGECIVPVFMNAIHKHI